MDLIGYIIVAIAVYLLGLSLFIRFGAFLHRCDNEARKMLRKRSPVRTRIHLLRKSRNPRPKPRLRAA